MAQELSIILSLQSAEALAKLNTFVGEAGSKLGALASSFAALAGVSAGFIGIEQLTAQVEELDHMSEQMGVSIERMQGMAYAAKLADVDLGQLRTGMRTFSQWLEKTGQGSKSLEQALLEQADIFSKLQNGADKNSTAVERFGRTGLQLIPILNQGSDALRQMFDRGEMLGGLNDKLVDDSLRFQKEWKEVVIVMKSFALVLADTIIPPLTEVIKRVTSGLLEIRSAVEAFQRWMQGMGGVEGLVAGSGIQKGLGADSNKLIEEALQQDAEVGPLTKEKYEAQKGRLENLISLSKMFMEAAKSREVGPDEKLAIDNTNLALQIKYLKELRDLGGKAEVSGLISHQENQNLGTSTQTKIIGLKQKIIPTDFMGELKAQLADLEKSWGTTMQRMASTVKSTIVVGIHSVAQNLTAVIMGTKTWSDALKAIGTTVLQTLIEQIIEMGVQWVLTHVIMRGAMSLTHALGVALGWEAAAQTTAQETAKAPAIAVNAAGTSISSYGAAAIVGAALALVAIGAIIGALAFKEQGGPVFAGRPYVVGEKRPELFVPSQNGYIIPSVPSGSVSQSGQANHTTMISVHNWNDEAAMTKHIKENPKTHHVILDKLRKSGHIIGARS